MVARLRAQAFQQVCKAREAEKRGDRDGWLRANKAWIRLMQQALAC